jgi:RNA polymerase sigma factor (sigma-70 family)
VTWLEHHTASSRAAAEAEIAARESESARARTLYRRAAEAEEKALSELDPTKRRTLGITAVSAVALWCKGGAFDRAKQLAHRLAKKDLPSFATRQIREILEAIPAEPGRRHPEGVETIVESDEEEPEELLAAHELVAEIEQAIGKLRPEYRQAIVLHAIAALPYEEIAQIMSLTLGTVKTYIHRGRKELQEMLAHTRV